MTNKGGKSQDNVFSIYICKNESRIQGCKNCCNQENASVASSMTLKPDCKSQMNCFERWIKNLSARHRISKRIHKHTGKCECAMLFQPNKTVCDSGTVADLLHSVNSDCLPRHIRKVALKKYNMPLARSQQDSQHHLANSIADYKFAVKNLDQPVAEVVQLSVEKTKKFRTRK